MIFSGWFHEEKTIYFEVEAESLEEATKLVESGDFEVVNESSGRFVDNSLEIAKEPSDEKEEEEEEEEEQ